MFDLYFSARVTARLRASPDASWLRSFLAALHRRGHARLCVQYYLREAELFGLWLRRCRRTLATVTDADVRAFADRPPLGRSRHTAAAAIRWLLRHLRDRRRIPRRPARTHGRIERIVAAYDAHLSAVAGLAPATRLYRRRYAREFLGSVFGAGTGPWSRLRPEHVRRFVAGYARTDRVAAAAVAAGAIRSFLRWLQFRGRIGPALVAAVPRFPRWRLAPLPPVLADDRLAGILATFDRTTPVGRRDYAMAACLIDLGLRVGEVADLGLADVDIVAGVVRLAAGKPRRERVLPLPDRVRLALADYTHRGRPATTDRHLFVRHTPPAGTPVTRELVRGVVRRAYAAVPGCERLTGTHILRHTTASRLLRAGADLKRIADILGHRSVDTTAIYAKVDRDRLAAVAMPWPSGKGVRS